MQTIKSADLLSEYEDEEVEGEPIFAAGVATKPATTPTTLDDLFAVAALIDQAMPYPDDLERQRHPVPLDPPSCE